MRFQQRLLFRSLPRRVLLGLLAAPLAGLLAGCAATGGSGLFSAPAPRLAVFLVVDGLPQRQVLAYRDQLAPDGFARFLDRGTWFAEAHYRHAFTVTAAGHASMLTGAYPHRTGIIGNDWRNVATGAQVYNTGDTSYTYIGAATKPLDGTSPNNLKVETVGDVLRRTVPGSKVVGISGKDRGAILPAGHAGTAYMYMGESGGFSSSTYYMKQHPAWVDAFNAAKPADRFFKAEWKPLLPEAAYARSLPDSQPWFGPAGGKLPMMMGTPADDKPGPRFYGALLASPFADALSLQFARAAIAGERLGLDADTPDILIVSLSGHDYVNHRWSAESRLSHDHFLQLDRMLQALFKDLDEAIGADNYVVALTADHGFMQAPEVSQAQGLGGGRVAANALLAAINAELEKRFGAPKLAAFLSAQAVVLDRKLLAERKLDADTVADAARAALLAQPAIGAAYTRKELQGNQAGAPFFDAMRRAWHPDVSGDVQYVLKPYWMMGSSVTTHGSPHPYDTQVPLLLWGPRWVGRGRVDTPVEPIDLAPTLAALLKVETPSGSEGKPLPLPLSFGIGR